MGFLKKALNYIRGSISPFGNGSLRTRKIVSQVKQKCFEDSEDLRAPEEFEILLEARRVANDSSAEFVTLCNKQISLTPDFDMPYLWLSNGQNAQGDTEASIATLLQGLEYCKKTSSILGKIGERFLHEKHDIEGAIVFIAKSISAQTPMRTNHQAYLYFGYFCIFTEYGNAGEKALKVARGIYGDIDLNSGAQNEIKSLISLSYQTSQKLVFHYIQILREEGRID